VDKVSEDSEANEVGNDADREHDDCQTVGRILDEFNDFHLMDNAEGSNLR
jgi:hypothetical protein